MNYITRTLFIHCIIYDPNNRTDWLFLQYWNAVKGCLLFLSNFCVFLEDITKWRKPVRCTAELPTCSRWPRTGVVFRCTDQLFLHAFITLKHTFVKSHLHCQQNLKSLCIFVFTSLFFSAAGNAFCKAARLHMQLQNKHDCATSFIDAGNAYKKSDPNGKNVWLLNGIKSHFFAFFFFTPNQTCKNWLLWCVN